MELQCTSVRTDTWYPRRKKNDVNRRGRQARTKGYRCQSSSDAGRRVRTGSYLLQDPTPFLQKGPGVYGQTWWSIRGSAACFTDSANGAVCEILLQLVQSSYEVFPVSDTATPIAVVKCSVMTVVNAPLALKDEFSELHERYDRRELTLKFAKQREIARIHPQFPGSIFLFHTDPGAQLFLISSDQYFYMSPCKKSEKY